MTDSTRYSPVSMAKDESLTYFGHPCVPQRIWLPQPGKRLKQRKTGNQEDRFDVAIIMHSVGNNKTTVCYLAIPR